ncbi:MAG TPA: hypothetical protein VMK65_07820 [Longimicrobiales bacterium]|nr:hypothetical protein [Longimicrobiales bacterium]
MALRDLLWACPLCGTEEAIEPAGRAEACRHCGARYRRGPGATIEARRPDGGSERAPGPAWLERLPAITVFPPPAQRRETPVRARFGAGERPVRRGGRLLGFHEVLGEAVDGTLILEPGRLTFRSAGGERHAWPFDALTAIQPSSSTVQVKARGEAVVSFRFPATSARFWEELLQEALRLWYRERCRGEIREFQPRIVVGPAA